MQVHPFIQNNLLHKISNAESNTKTLVFLNQSHFFLPNYHMQNPLSSKLLRLIALLTQVGIIFADILEKIVTKIAFDL